MKYCTIFSSNWLDKFQNQILNNSSINFNGLFGQIFLLFSTKKPPPFLASFAKQRSGVKLTSWNRTVKMRSVRKGPTYVQSSASSSGEQGATSQSTIFSRGFSVALSPSRGPAQSRLVRKDHSDQDGQLNTSDSCAWLFHGNFYPRKESKVAAFSHSRWCRSENRW